MRTCLLSFILLTSIVLNASAQSLQNTVKQIRSLNQATFTEIIRSKFSFQDDFSVDTFKTRITAVATEPQIGGYYLIKGKKDTYLFNGDKGIWLNHRDSTYKMQKEYWIGGQNSRTLLSIANDIEGYLKTPSKIKQLPDTLIGNNAYTHFFVSKTDSLYKGDHIYSYIDIITYKTNSLPFIIRMDSQGFAGDGARMGMFEQHTFKAYDFNEKNFPDLSVASVPAGYKLPVKKEQLPMLAAGTRAPLLKLKDINGRDFDMAGLHGKMVLLNFTLDGCPHCVNAAQMLTRLNNIYKSKGLEIISIYQLGLDNFKNVTRFDKKFNIKYPSYLTERTAANIYHLNGYPTFYLVNKQGAVVQAYEGFYAELEKEITEKLAAINE
jgi:thiol-disulfide isomerase/thioredoxin